MDLDPSVILMLIRGIYAGFVIVVASMLWRYMRRVRYVPRQVSQTVAEPQLFEAVEEYLILRLDALPGRDFETERVYKKLRELGLLFNEGAFDYRDAQLNQVIFSVLNQKKPHVLPDDPHVLRNFNSLMFVMRLPIADGSHQVRYFTTLLAVMDELRKHLKANICNEHGTKLKNDDLYGYQQRIESFEQRYGDYLANAYRD